MSEVKPSPCFECAADGEPWTFECDQCNPDGIYNKKGERIDGWMQSTNREGHWYTR